MRIEELNWFDVEQYLKSDDRLMWVLGSCEQHAYLSLLTDVRIPQTLADAASQQTGVLVAPPLNFGSSPYFLAYPGTFSLRIHTLLDIVEDVIRSAYKQGFRRLLILNGHGGNDPARSRLYELLNELPGLRIAWYAWWQSHSVEQVAIQHNLKRAHANWMEAFAFTQVADLPSIENLRLIFLVCSRQMQPARHMEMALLVTSIRSIPRSWMNFLQHLYKMSCSY